MADLIPRGELNAAILELLQNKNVRKNIKDQYGIDVTGAPSVREMTAAAQRMADILYSHMISDTQEVGHGLSTVPKSAIIIGKPVCVGKDGSYKIDISFDSSLLHRDSLYKEKYPEGINDIVSLFVHGYNAKNSVHGQWHGDVIWSLRNRAPNNFIQKAVDEFNSMNSGKDATAKVGDDYH